MESRELFLLLHLLPFLLVSRVGSDKKAPLSLSLFLPLLPAFSSCKRIQCSRSSTLAVLTPFWLEFKRRVFSRTPPPLFYPRRRRVERWWERGRRRSTSVLHWRAATLQSVCAPAPNACPWTERSDWCQLKWAVYKMAALTPSTGTTSPGAQRWNRSNTELYFPGLHSDSSPTILLHQNEILFSIRAPPRSHLITFKSVQTLILPLLFIYLLL